MRIEEKGSELLFGEFDEGDCFYLEQSNAYNKLKSHGFSSVEFLLFWPSEKKLLFIEGKRTLARRDNHEDFNRNLDAIARKFADSFQIALSAWIGGLGFKDELPLNYKCFFGKSVKYVFVLVVKKRSRNKQDLFSIQEGIKKKLKKERSLWEIDVIVLNEELAKKRRLVVLEST